MLACSVASVMSDSLRPHGPQATWLLCPRDSPGKNTWVGCHFLLQGIFPTQGSNLSHLCLLHWQAPPGRPYNYHRIYQFADFVLYLSNFFLKCSSKSAKYSPPPHKFPSELTLHNRVIRRVVLRLETFRKPDGNLITSLHPCPDIFKYIQTLRKIPSRKKGVRERTKSTTLKFKKNHIIYF